MRRSILGIPVDAVTRAEAVSTLRRFLTEPRGHFVTTPNPEMLMDARKDPAFRTALQASELAVPDGHGIVFVSRVRGWGIPERVTGTDLVADIAAMAAETGKSVFLLGGEYGEGSEAAEALKRAYPTLRVVGVVQCGALQRGDDGVWSCTDMDVVSAIRNAAPDILLVAFGHGKQETWIHAHLGELPSVRVAVGIGGAFNFIAGRAKRAPLWLRRLWLEWLWRLLREPHRYKRIFKAAVLFPLLALSSKD